MRKCMVFQWVIMLVLLALADPTFAAGNVPADRVGDDTEGGMVTVTAQGIFTGGDVTLSVTKTGDDSYSLYDSKRNIWVLSGAELPPLDSLALRGRFYDYFPHSDLYGDDTGSYIDHLILGNAESNERLDISSYLKLAGTVTSKGPFHDYRLKGITVSSLTYDGKDYMPSASAPLMMFRAAISHGKNRWSSLCDYMMQGLTASPIVLPSDELYSKWRVIPAEGAILRLFAIREKEGADPFSDDFWETADIATVSVPFVPNESGVTEIDQDGVKATITYERSASPNVDIYRNMVLTYDFYKNVFGREGYDGEGAPLCAMNWLPGGETGVITIDGKMPKYLFSTEQAGAYAKSEFSPAVIICGTGGRVTDLMNPELETVMLPMVEPSVLTHEFTHMVTKSTAQLSSNFVSEGGALNESFSDIMAISMMKTADYGYGPETPWLIGGHGLVLGKSCLRNMADPKQCLDGDDPKPDTYKGEYWNASDKYSMMGVQNKFYYLLCDGGKGTNDNDDDYDVSGIGIEKGMQIAYLTLTKYCSPESDYSNIRESWLKAAQQLYGENGAEAQAVAQAWAAVGIDGEDPSGIDTLRTDRQLGEHAPAWFSIDGRRLNGEPVRKGVYIHNGKKIVKSF